MIEMRSSNWNKFKLDYILEYSRPLDKRLGSEIIRNLYHSYTTDRIISTLIYNTFKARYRIINIHSDCVIEFENSHQETLFRVRYSEYL